MDGLDPQDDNGEEGVKDFMRVKANSDKCLSAWRLHGVQILLTDRVNNWCAPMHWKRLR